MSVYSSGKRSGRKKRKKSKFKYEVQLEEQKRKDAIQDRKDAEKLKLLEQQLAYIQWKKRKNGVKMKEAIARSQRMIETDAITEIAVDEMEEKRQWMQHIIADELKRPLRVGADEKNPGSYNVETKKRREITRLKNHHTAIKELEKTLKEKESRRRIHEKHRTLRAHTPPVPLWKSRHSVSSDGRFSAETLPSTFDSVVEGPMSTRRAAQIRCLRSLRRDVYKKVQTEKQYVKGLVKQQKDQPLSASIVDSVDSLRRPINRVRRSVTR